MTNLVSHASFDSSRSWLSYMLVCRVPVHDRLEVLATSANPVDCSQAESSFQTRSSQISTKALGNQLVYLYIYTWIYIYIHIVFLVAFGESFLDVVSRQVAAKEAEEYWHFTALSRSATALPRAPHAAWGLCCRRSW